MNVLHNMKKKKAFVAFLLSVWMLLSSLLSGLPIAVANEPSDASTSAGLSIPSAEATTTPAAISLVSATTDHLGKRIILEFDKPVADPVGKQGEFSVKVGGVSKPIASIGLGSDSKKIWINMSDKIPYTPTPSVITLTYTKGTLAAADGTALESFTDKPVTNTIALLELVDYEPTATEIAYEDNGTDGKVVKYRLDALMDYKNAKLAMYFTNGFFRNLEDNLINYVKFYEKDTKKAVILPNKVTVGIEGSALPNRQYPGPVKKFIGQQRGYMEITDWYFWQLQGAAPLGLDLKSIDLKPSTTYVIEIQKGFSFHTGPISNTYSFEFMTTPDIDAPTYPEGSSLSTSGVGESSVKLEWTPAQDNTGIKEYNIYQNNSLLTTVKGEITSYNVTNLSAGTEYSFKVEAVDHENNRSSSCVEVSVATLQATVPAGASLVSASTDHLGKKICLEFDRPMTDPAGKQSEFSVVIGEQSQPISRVALDRDPKKIWIGLADKIQYAPSPVDITLNYTKGTLTAVDGTALESFTNKPVTNAIAALELVDYEPAATEIAYEDNGTNGKVVKYRFDDLMDYKNAKLAMYFTNGFFNYFESNLENYVKFYEKDTGKPVVLPNKVTAGAEGSALPDRVYPGPVKEYIGQTPGYMEITDWYFWQLKGIAPLGLDLKSTDLKPSTTYVIEVLKGFQFNNSGLINNTYSFEFTTTPNEDKWQPVGAPGFSAGEVKDTSIYVEDGTPYVAFKDAANGEKATVMKYDGSHWVTVGNPGFSAGDVANTSLSLYVDHGTPYVAYVDSANSNKATVMKYDGSSWVPVGAAGFSAGGAGYISINVDHGTPYVAFKDSANGEKATVMKYDGSSWVPVGAAGFSVGGALATSLYIDNGTPYIVYAEYMDNVEINKATVMKYDGSSWIPVGTPGFSVGASGKTSLYVDRGTPYVAYVDTAHSHKATAMKYDGNSWVPVGAPGFSEGYAFETSIYVDHGTPYVSYVNPIDGFKATVMKYDGSSWLPVGNVGFANGGYSSLYGNNGTLYFVYSDDTNSDKATVMKYSIPSNTPVNDVPVYTVNPVEDTSYTNGATEDGITTMTVKDGVTGLKYFGVQVETVKAHTGEESVVFVHMRNGAQLSINVSKADFDEIHMAYSGFNVQPGDIIKAYIVDDISNAVDFNPIILQ